ncbi:hypothetical protein BAR153v2_008920 [Bartonella sp. AR 15-3]|nr:hypothetical protein BAR153v2_008920 [Bartonella sp. AR 15-3]CBI79031.1 hypothetical protein BAR15_120070 [Bartonella sp. AR 15-3]
MSFRSIKYILVCSTFVNIGMLFHTTNVSWGNERDDDIYTSKDNKWYKP